MATTLLPAVRLPKLAPAATISTAVLLPHDRVARMPLSWWAERLLIRISEDLTRLRGVRQFAAAVAGIANNAALIMAHAGDAAAARQICELQRRWSHRFSRRASDLGIAARGIQPWVNLGRLDALSGDWEKALVRFGVLEQGRLGAPLVLSPFRVPADAWDGISDHPAAFMQYLEDVYVVDSLKALLLNRRFAEIIAFAEALGASRRRAVARFADEARVVALSSMGDHTAARAVAKAGALQARGWKRAVFRLRGAEAAACAGCRDRADVELRAMVPVVLAVSSAVKRDLQCVYVLHRLAAACWESDLVDEASAVARDVLILARAIQDQAFEIESLRLLACLHPDGGWGDALAEAEEATEYARYRRERTRTPSTAIAELSETLCALLQS